MDELKVNKPKSRELPVQQNLTDTSQNGKHLRYGQLKAKPELESRAHLFSLAWKEVITDSNRLCS